MLLLIPFPDQIPQFFGVPQVQQAIYPSITVAFLLVLVLGMDWLSKVAGIIL